MKLVSPDTASWNFQLRISLKVSKQNPYWILGHCALRNTLFAPLFNWKNDIRPWKSRWNLKNKGFEDDFTTPVHAFFAFRQIVGAHLLAALRSSWTFSELWFWDGNKCMDFQDKRLRKMHILHRLQRAEHTSKRVVTCDWSQQQTSWPGPRPGGTFFQIEDAGVPSLRRNFNLIEGAGTKIPVSMMPVFRISSKVIPGSHLREGTCKQDSWPCWWLMQASHRNIDYERTAIHQGSGHSQQLSNRLSQSAFKTPPSHRPFLRRFREIPLSNPPCERDVLPLKVYDVIKNIASLKCFLTWAHRATYRAFVCMSLKSNDSFFGIHVKFLERTV